MARKRRCRRLRHLPHRGSYCASRASPQRSASYSLPYYIIISGTLKSYKYMYVMWCGITGSYNHFISATGTHKTFTFTTSITTFSAPIPHQLYPGAGRPPSGIAAAVGDTSACTAPGAAHPSSARTRHTRCTAAHVSLCCASTQTCVSRHSGCTFGRTGPPPSHFRCRRRARLARQGAAAGAGMHAVECTTRMRCTVARRKRGDVARGACLLSGSVSTFSGMLRGWGRQLTLPC